MMYFDGSFMVAGAGAGVVLTSPKGYHLEYAIRLHFPTTNNVVEYEAIIHGLKIAFVGRLLPLHQGRLRASRQLGHEGGFLR